MVQMAIGRLDALRRKPPEEIRGHRKPGFHTADRIGLWTALRDVVLFWVEQGVEIFPIDNPHTKPLPFWEWLIGEIHKRNSNVIFWRKRSRGRS